MRNVLVAIFAWNVFYGVVHATWTLEDQQNAAASASQTSIAWKGCIEASKNRYKESNESIDNIATAVVASCEAEQDAYQSKIYYVFEGLDPAQRRAAAQKAIDNARSRFRETVVQFLVEERLNKRAPTAKHSKRPR